MFFAIFQYAGKSYESRVVISDGMMLILLFGHQLDANDNIYEVQVQVLL